MDFHSHFSDNFAQNSATAFENMKVFIYWIYENNMFMEDGIIYDHTNGCSKQYRYKNPMCLFSVLKFTYRVIIDICIENTGHRGRKIDSVNGSDNSYLRQKMCIIGTE